MQGRGCLSGDQTGGRGGTFCTPNEAKGTQKISLKSLKQKEQIQIQRVKVQRRDFTGLRKGNRDICGAGGLAGIGHERTVPFFCPRPRPEKIKRKEAKTAILLFLRALSLRFECTMLEPHFANNYICLMNVLPDRLAQYIGH